MRGIADSGLLTPEQLDGMALAFLAADRYVYWPVPDAWFTTESVALVVSDDVGEDADEVAVSEGPAVAARDVAPPLRRWAAARLVAREPAAWPRLLARAQDLDARHGAAVVAGMFDSIEVMPAAAQAWLVTKGTTWPHQSVRRAALEVPDSGVTPDITIECTGVAEVIADVIANSAPDAMNGVSTPGSPLPFDLGGWNRGAVLGNDINLIRPRC